MPSLAQKRTVFSELAKGWNSGGCGFCKRLGHHADRRQDAVLHALAPLRRGVERPWRGAGRHLPELAVEGQHLLGPALLDDAEVLLEGQPIGVVDLVVLVGQRAVDAVRLLRHDVDPAPLVAAREARIGAAAGHVVEHGDVFGDADRIAGRQHDAELADADALGLHREVEVEQHRIVGELEALDVEVMLGEAHRIVAELVAELYLLAELPQHALIEVRVHAGHAGLDLGAAADARQIEQRRLHPLRFLRLMGRRVARFPAWGRWAGACPGRPVFRRATRPAAMPPRRAACRRAAGRPAGRTGRSRRARRWRDRC